MTSAGNRIAHPPTTVPVDRVRQDETTDRGHDHPAVAGWVSLKLRELWEYRELLYFLTWRDIKVRYKQTALGAAWAIHPAVLHDGGVQRLLRAAGQVPSDGMPYPLFSYCGAGALDVLRQRPDAVGNSLVASQHLITKVYFPRLVIPIAAVLAGLVDFAIAFVVLLA